jgi:hypothetical protein
MPNLKRRHSGPPRQAPGARPREGARPERSPNCHEPSCRTASALRYYKGKQVRGVEEA